MLSNTAWTVAAAGVGLCVIGYCIYFDRKRRSDPFFRQKLRESTYPNSILAAVDHVFTLLIQQNTDLMLFYTSLDLNPCTVSV